MTEWTINKFNGDYSRYSEEVEDWIIGTPKPGDVVNITTDLFYEYPEEREQDLNGTSMRNTFSTARRGGRDEAARQAWLDEAVSGTFATSVNTAGEIRYVDPTVLTSNTIMSSDGEGTITITANELANGFTATAVSEDTDTVNYTMNTSEEDLQLGEGLLSQIESSGTTTSYNSNRFTIQDLEDMVNRI